MHAAVHQVLGRTILEAPINCDSELYTTVIMTEVIARVHSVHLVKAEQRQAAADPQTKPPDLGCESAYF